MLKSELSNLQRKDSYESEYNAKKIPSSNYADMLTVAEWELSTDAIDKLNSCPKTRVQI